MKFRLLLFAFFVFLLGLESSYGQLLQWNTFGNLGTETTEPSVANDVNIASANLTQGTITAAGNGNRFGGSNWWNTGDSASNTLVQAVAGNDYIQFIVTPNSGYSFTPTSLVFGWDRSNSGPSSVTLRSSVDGYVADLGSVTGMLASQTNGNTITISGLTNITTATTFRIYGYGATATGGTGGFDVASNVVNVQLNGTTAATTPTQLALVNVPATGTTGALLSSFTVEGRNAGNVLVPSFTGLVTLTRASGSGSINGTLTATAVAGVATFNNIAFDQASTYTITAASGVLTPATSGSVVISNPSTNIFGGDGVNFVGQINSYSQPTNCTYGDYRVLKYRKVNTTSATPTDGRGQWVNTVNVQASGGDVTPLNMSGGGGTGFLFTSGGGCGATGTYTNKWAFGGVGQGTVDAINGTTFNGSTDMGFNMNTAGRYTFVLKDAGYTTTGYYVGYTTNAPVTISHNTGTQRTLNNDGTTTITATISATKSPEENFYVRFKTGSNDFSTGGSTISAVGSVVGTTVTFTIPVQADGTVVYYYIFSSTMSQVALAALSEGDKSYALLNYADNNGSNYTYTALTLTPTVTSIVPTAVTGVTGQANNTGFKGQTITINGTNFQSNSTVTINGVVATTTFVSASQLTAVVANTGANFTGNVVVANPTPVTSTTVSNFNFLGYITTGTGAINTASNWLGGSVPLANSTVTIAHTMTHSGGATTGTPFASLTIPTGGSLAIGSTGAVAVTNAITTNGTGTLSWSAAGTLNISAGGTITNNGIVNSSTFGNVVFAGAGTINGTNAITFNNLTINGTTTLTTIPTINGTLQLNSGSSVTATPSYGGSSTLVYNTTGTYGVSNEWTGNGTAAASGIPQNVTIQNSTTLTMPSTNRGLAGNLNISIGNLTLNATSGDLYLAGNWTRASAASFTPNNRAVFFNGSTTQTVTVTVTGTETFNYLTVAGSGTLRLATAINVTASSGLSLSSTHATSTIDLNGQTLTLSGGGNLNLNTGSRFITSSAANGKLVITSNTITVTNGGTLTTAATNTTIDLQNGLNCGTGSLVTINGTLQINANGFCIGNSPKYGVNSTLQYNSNTIYNRQLEWTADIAAVGTIGLPTNVQISNNTTLNYINSLNSGTKGIAGNLTIDAGSSFYMDYGSVSSGGVLTLSGNLVSAGNMTLGFASGDDLKIGGNITFNTGYTFDAKNRAIFFTKNGTQIITASSTPTFNKILFTPTSGTTTVQLAASPATSLNITTPLAGGDSIDFGTASNEFDINIGNTLTLGNAGRTNTISGTNGTFKGTTTSNLTLLGTGTGTGSMGTLRFTSGSQVLGNLTLDRQASTIGFDLGTGLTINGILALTNGIANLSNQTMIITLAGSITGASPANYIIADFTAGGILRKNFTNGTGTASSFTFPIGDRVASENGTQYSPATLNFTAANYASGWAALAVEDNPEPNIDAPTDFITRYWRLTSSGITSATYNFTGNYLPVDITGDETICKSGRYSTSNSTWTDGATLVSGANTVSLTGLTSATGALTSPNHFTASFRNREINIKGLTGGNNNIVSGSTTASGLNNTLFAGTNIGSSSTKDYEIQNLGIAALNLTANPIVSIGGVNPGDFAVTSVPATPIVGGSSTTFIITFSPTYTGIRTAIVSIANNDTTGSENPYTFLIQGTGDCLPATNTITPTSGPVGTEVTINATANNLFSATASFNTVPATISNYSLTMATATVIKAIVPATAVSGNLITTNSAGCQATNAFTVIDNKANTCQGGTVATDLFISEVTDATTGGLSYVEIYNGTSSTINMNGYSLKTYSNGDTFSPSTLALNNFTLNPGSVYVVAIGTATSPDAFNTCSITGGNGSLANQTSTSVGVNFDTSDNDYIGLYKNSTSSIIDSFGTFGSDNWADGLGLGDRGATFRRKNNVTVPNLTSLTAHWNITDWIGAAQASCNTNDYSDIGFYNFISGTPPTVTAHPSYTPTCKATSLTVAGTEGYNGTSPADTNELTYQWFVSAPNAIGWTEIISTTDGSIYTNFNTATLNISNIAGILNSQFYCQIRENTNTCYAASNAIKIILGQSTTWQVGNTWSNLVPTIDTAVIIDHTYDTANVFSPSFNACSVIVNSGKTVTVRGGNYINIKNELTVTLGGTVTFENNASLVQINNGANSGDITYKRMAQQRRSDYVYWSSPVESFNINSHPSNGNKYSWNTLLSNANGSLGNWQAASGIMTAGQGYIVSGPSSFGNDSPQNLEVPFFGVPRNGNITIPIYRGSITNPIILPPPAGSVTILDDNWNLLGNPYPSSISCRTFLTDNNSVLTGALYIWTHGNLPSSTNGNPFYSTFAANYNPSDYMAYNLTGGMANLSTDYYIGAGQGFFVTMIEGSTGSANVNFNNSLRSTTYGNSTGTNFFRSTAVTETENPEFNRIWLDLIKNNNSVRTLVGYVSGASMEKDNLHDAISKYDNSSKIYSLINEERFVIQGRSLPFNNIDQVKIGIDIIENGQYSIGIAMVDGLFLNAAQNIFLEDKVLNIIHNLRQSPYTFTATNGIYTERFVLRYTNGSALDNPDFETLNNSVVVSTNNGVMTINSSIENIQDVIVFDILGRQLFEAKGIYDSVFIKANISRSNQTLIVKIKLENGTIVTRKIIL